MSNYSKIKLGNASIYDVISGGIRAADERLVLFILPGEKNLGEIDAEFDTPTNVKRIEILNPAGDVDNVKHGYVYMSDCQRKKDYVIASEHVETGTDETGNPIMEYQDIVGTVMVITLTKSDIRKELDTTKADVSSLNETVDMLLIANLEG